MGCFPTVVVFGAGSRTAACLTELVDTPIFRGRSVPGVREAPASMRGILETERLLFSLTGPVLLPIDGVAVFDQISAATASRVRFPAPEQHGTRGMMACKSAPATPQKTRDNGYGELIETKPIGNNLRARKFGCANLSKRSSMQLLKPRYSRRPSEAEIQSEVFEMLRRFGLDPRLEVFGYIPIDACRKKRCIFDVVVFWPLNHRPLCIIECKKGLGVCRKNRQIERYNKFGLPVLICGRNDVIKTMREVRSLAYENRKDAPPSFDWMQFGTKSAL